MSCKSVSVIRWLSASTSLLLWLSPMIYSLLFITELKSPMSTKSVASVVIFCIIFLRSVKNCIFAVLLLGAYVFIKIICLLSLCMDTARISSSVCSNFALCKYFVFTRMIWPKLWFDPRA